MTCTRGFSSFGRIAFFLPLLLALLGCGPSRLASAPQPPDMVFYNGRIVTMDAGFTMVPALAVRDGRVLATGTDAEIQALAGSGTQRIDLAGKMMLPGLIDSHMHPNQAAISEADHAIPDMASIADVLAYVKARAKVLPEGEWIWVRTVHPGRLKERRYPTRAELDAVAPKHPVGYAPWIYFPKASFNSAALALMGVDQDLAATAPAHIERDADTGAPTGLIRRHTRYVDDHGAPDVTDEQEKETLFKDMMRVYNAVGLTTISDRKATAEWMDIYQRINAKGAMTVRLSMMGELNTARERPIESVTSDIKALADKARRLDGPYLSLIGVKTFIDGGITSGTAYLEQPWGKSDLFAIDDPNYQGNLTLSGDRLDAMIEASVRAGLQFTGHTVGDKAVATLVDAYERVNAKLLVAPTRPSLTHANFINPPVMEKMARLGVVADIQPAWLYLDGAMMVQQLGLERMRYFQALQSLSEAGVIYGGGSDHWHRLDPQTAVNPFDPFMGMWIAVTRQARNHDTPLYPQEALTCQQALRMYTTNNAYLLFREDEIGSLEPGKLADMIVIDRDIVNGPIDDLRHTKVLQTYLNGELVYQADD
ncbi:MAG: amidohydrolase [Sphingomonadales bacterium]